MRLIQNGMVLAIAGMLAACAQQDGPTTMVAPEPVFDKYGGGSCEEGYTYIPGTASMPPLCEPDDCEESSVTGAASDLCPPPTDRPDGDDSSTSGGRPAGTAARP